jgi:hypothetical protein
MTYLQTSARSNQGSIPPDVLATISDALPRLLDASITSTASLLDKNIPEFHQKALDALHQGADHEKFVYLRHLLGPPPSEDEGYIISSEFNTSSNVTQPQRHLYIALQCQFYPSAVIEVLKYLPSDILDWSQVMQICEERGVYHAVIWATNQGQKPRDALAKAEAYEKRLTLNIVQRLLGDVEVSSEMLADVDKEVNSLEAVGRIEIQSHPYFIGGIIEPAY